MPDPTSPPGSNALPWRAGPVDDSLAKGTEKLVRETWRHYYVAQLAEAQFGPASMEAAIARSRALDAYRELRASLRSLDPYYRGESQPYRATSRTARHLALVTEDPSVEA